MNKRGGLGDSPFFKSPAPAEDESVLPNNTTQEHLLFTSESGPIEANSVRTDVRAQAPLLSDPKPRRIKIRHAFNIYSDQLQRLQAFELERVRAGKKKKTLSAMVCRALDDFIVQENKRRRRS